MEMAHVDLGAGTGALFGFGEQLRCGIFVHIFLAAIRHTLAGTAFTTSVKPARSRVTVAVPAVFRVTVKALYPATSAALAGNVAAPSLDVMPTVWVLDT